MFVDSEEERLCPAFEILLVTEKIYIPDRKISLDFSRCSDILIHRRLDPLLGQPRPQSFSLKKWVGREKALASAGHVSLRTM